MATQQMPNERCIGCPLYPVCDIPLGRLALTTLLEQCEDQLVGAYVETMSAISLQEPIEDDYAAAHSVPIGSLQSSLRAALVAKGRLEQ